MTLPPATAQRLRFLTYPQMSQMFTDEEKESYLCLSVTSVDNEFLLIDE